MEVLSERWGLSPSCLYRWRQAFLLRGLDSLVYHQSGGRRPTLTPRQKKRVVELLEAGPQVVGCETACWTSVLIRGLIWREFGVLYTCQDVCTLLHNLGFSFQKARFVSDHLDVARRHAWLQEEWPRLLRAAKRRHGLILFEDEARTTDMREVVHAIFYMLRGGCQWRLLPTDFPPPPRPVYH